MKYVRNQYGIAIKKCCASCAHKHIIGKASVISRLCDAGEGVVQPSHLCKDWRMVAELDNAGKGGGRVKRPDYIDFLRRHPIGGETPVSVFREEWLKQGKPLYDKDLSRTTI